MERHQSQQEPGTPTPVPDKVGGSHRPTGSKERDLHSGERLLGQSQSIVCCSCWKDNDTVS